MKSIDRLFQYLDYKDIKPTKYEKEIGLSNGYLGTQKRRNADLGETIVRKILNNSMDINPNWLLTGEGDMLKKAPSTDYRAIMDDSDRKRIVSEPPLSYGTSSHNIFSGYTDDQISEYIQDKFARHLLDMYENGRAYPAKIVKSLIADRDRTIVELQMRIKELERQVDRTNKTRVEEYEKDRI